MRPSRLVARPPAPHAKPAAALTTRLPRPSPPLLASLTLPPPPCLPHPASPTLAATPFSEWLWGGMQYQLEHHLFPTMPRYRYRALAPRVAAWCAAHTHLGAEYRADLEWQILARNFRMLRDVGKSPAVPGAPLTRKDTVWSRRRGAAWVGSAAALVSPPPQPVPAV